MIGREGVAAGADVVAARGVSFAYPARNGRGPVLRGVDLSVCGGELVALVGPNGSGKTTLLRLLAGTLRPTAGEVLLGGEPLGRLSRREVARRVAVLPQFPELPGGFRVRELVEMGRAPHATALFGGSDADRLAVDRALGDAGALALADRYVGELSGGERQVTLIAMVLAQQPSLLLLDEPTVHLDLAHQVALLDAIRRLTAQRGIGVVAVVHDLNLAAAYADRVVVLAAGAVAASGRPDDVLSAGLVSDVFGVSVDRVPDGDGRPVLAIRPEAAAG